MTGIGIAPPGVSLSPISGLNFAATGLGLSSSPQTVTLTNNGGTPLSLASITAAGDFAVVAGTGTCGATLAPSAVCTFALAFTPSATGPRTGALTVADNAASSPQTLPLRGLGVDFALALNGASTLAIATGHAATYSLLLSSAAGLSGSVAFTCSGAPAHSTCTVNPSTAALGAATPITVTVATGLSTARLHPPALPQRTWLPQAIWAAFLLPAGFALTRRRPRAALLTLALITLIGCSTARTLPGSEGVATTTTITPSGSYAIVVAGSSTGLVRSVNLTLTIQ